MRRFKRIGFLILTTFITMVISSWMIWHILSGGKRIPNTISKYILEIAQIPTITHEILSYNLNYRDSRLIFDTSKTTGFQYLADSSLIPNGKILLSTITQKKDLEIKLIQFPSGLLIKKWEIEAKVLIKIDRKLDINNGIIQLFHPMLLFDSSIIVNTNSALLCIGSDNKLKWINNEIFHHSIEPENDSIIWACSRIEKIHSFSINSVDTLINDAIAQVNVISGKTIFKKSVAEILYENGFQYLLAIGKFENDALHLNEVYPANYNSKYWRQGDLLISIRHRSTVFLYRPSTNKVLWLKSGPWSNQHCSTFIDSSKIIIFGNDIIRSTNNLSYIFGYNQIYIYDFAKNQITTPYNDILKKLKIKTSSGGRVTYFNNGKLFIDESENGKIYIIDSLNPLLKYTERFDPNHIKLFNWNRLIPN